MDNVTFTGLIAVAVVVVTCLAIARTLAKLALPWRIQLFERAAALVNKPTTRAEDRRLLNWYMDEAMSARAGWIPVKAVWFALRHRDAVGNFPKTGTSPEVKSVGIRFMGSTLFANPVALIAFGGLFAALMIVERERARKALQQTASQMPAAHCHSMA